jgi:hypothetical protein
MNWSAANGLVLITPELLDRELLLPRNVLFPYMAKYLFLLFYFGYAEGWRDWSSRLVEYLYCDPNITERVKSWSWRVRWRHLSMRWPDLPSWIRKLHLLLFYSLGQGLVSTLRFFYPFSFLLFYSPINLVFCSVILFQFFNEKCSLSSPLKFDLQVHMGSSCLLA